MSALFLLASPATAHEEPAPYSTQPIDWLLPIAAYAVPGVVVIVLLNEFCANLRPVARLIGAIAFPAVFWTLLLSVILPTKITFFEMVSGLFDFLFFDIGMIVWIPAGAIIAVCGWMDQRRRKKAELKDRYAEL
ncbi:hypothetical protein [Pontixanthobacter aquaemixtae]|uniref:Uncharacterized protein n=1 Tax=Pontixanthobacter aquaemixtae TaxID=1958940 RepID=A0A844ZQ93_9SPHN|nr:hypothetical protein [Pontixanthobacter aquaemixtae]MXO90511.1 hypothetical protein [Pontixanthobacter aquaemixtae]